MSKQPWLRRLEELEASVASLSDYDAEDTNNIDLHMTEKDIQAVRKSAGLLSSME